MSPPVVVVGSYNRDTSLFVAHFPAAGETIQALGSNSSHGGKGSNQAVQAARLGVPVAIVACVGSDQLGEAAKSLWQAEGIVIDAVADHATAPTGSATILIDEKGENLIIVVPGANGKLSTDHVENAAAVIETASVVVAPLEVPKASVVAAFSLAHRRGAITILNAAPAPREADGVLLALTDYLIVNEGEARTLAGGHSSALAAARALVSQVGRGVILTLGSKGAVLLECDGVETSIPAPSIVPIDTTGAGDAVVGAFAALLADGTSPREALELAVKAGSFACTAHGTVNSFGNRAQISTLG